VELNGEVRQLDYLTPVAFDRAVLHKYYADTSKYSVRDGTISCGSLWSARVDLNHDDKVVAYLGDLEEDLDYEEKLHWRQFNLASGAQISKVAYARDFAVQFANPTELSLQFRQQYEWLSRKLRERQECPLWRSLDSQDEHCLEALKIPLTNGQSEFDQEISNLSKVLIEYVNVDGLKRADDKIDSKEREIRTLGTYLEHKTGKTLNEEFSIVIEIWKLRQGSAHAKGSEYQDALSRLGYEEGNRIELFRTILKRVIAMMKWLAVLLLPEQDRLAGS